MYYSLSVKTKSGLPLVEGYTNKKQDVETYYKATYGEGTRTDFVEHQTQAEAKQTARQALKSRGKCTCKALGLLF